MDITQHNDERCQQLCEWLNKTCQLNMSAIEPLAGDASFRRYFRIYSGDQSFVAMDAPTHHEDSHPFVAIAREFANLNLHVPEILFNDLERGFLLISDLGDDLYLSKLNQQSSDALYQGAFEQLFKIQACQQVPHWPLPVFDAAFIQMELNRFPDWYLQHELQFHITTRVRSMFAELSELLIDNVLQQPRVCVHRDYHSRNLICDGDKVGVIDFQDAVIGPISYDLVSLLRDAYIAWPRHKVRHWALQFKQMAVANKSLSTMSDDAFMRWFDLMGVQRHIKVIGIFSRLNHRDGKPSYMQDVPRVFAYLLDVATRYPELNALLNLLEEIKHNYKQSVLELVSE